MNLLSGAVARTGNSRSRLLVCFRLVTLVILFTSSGLVLVEARAQIDPAVRDVAAQAVLQVAIQLEATEGGITTPLFLPMEAEQSYPLVDWF
jgi:hypothetical protein